MKLIKVFGASAAVGLAVLTLASCGQSDDPNGYTYHSYSSALGSNWNPHTWETNADSSIAGYIESPLVDLSIKDSKKGEYQWVYEMATAVTDVTKTHQNDLVKYAATLPDGVTDATQVEEGMVYEIKLNQKAKWQNGEAINADTYINSMKLLLSPAMKNYRANTYVSGESAVAGAYDYYYAGYNYGDATNAYEHYDAANDSKLVFHWKKANAKKTAFLTWAYDKYGTYIGTPSYPTLLAFLTAGFGGEFTKDDDFYTNMDGKTVSEIKADPDMKLAWEELTSFWNESADDTLQLVATEYERDAVDWSTVGIYKVDDYTFNYVLQNAELKDYFMTSLTSNWLVYEPLYTKLYDTTGKLTTTTYDTSLETTMAYGPYKMASFEAGKQMTFVQNENWYGYEKNDAGKLVSYTQFNVDGKKVQQYQTDKIVVDVMNDDTAKQKFMKGELDDWAPLPEELNQYTTSTQLYQVDETYQMSLFFHTDAAKLAAMDNDGTNVNGKVLQNYNFRKAFSLAINRAEWVTATAGYKPAYSLLNSLYFYNVFEDPSSSYRNTDYAMKAIVDLYGVEYGADKTYKTLEEAYKSITGYNLTEAKALMKTACEELVEAGLYTAGQEVKFKVAYKKGALDSTDQAQVTLLQTYLRAAAEGSGFGTISLEAVGNLDDRYGAVAGGEYAIGYGAWGGAAFYPFTNMQVYMDADKYDLNEAGCWSPDVEQFTLTINGVDETHDYQWWANCMDSGNKYANADFDTKLYILSRLENDFLNKYYRIPLASSTSCSLLSFKMNYYTEDYNIMYGFGGLRLISYNYTNGEWAKYVAEQGGTLNYKG